LMIDFLDEGASSRSKQEMPRNSQAVRKPTIDRCFLIHASSALQNSQAVRILYLSRKAEIWRPIPHTSSTGYLRKISSRFCSSFKAKMPLCSGWLFAIALATLARVLVEATPMETGIPVHWRVLL